MPSQGSTLIELLVALVLGLLLSLSAVLWLDRSTRSYKNLQIHLTMQDNLRFGLGHLANDVAAAGFFGPYTGSPEAVVVEGSAQQLRSCWTPAAPASGAFQIPSHSLELLGDAGSALTAQQFPCIRPEEFQVKTDVLAIQKVSAHPASDRISRHIYLHTDGARAWLLPADVSHASADTVHTYAPVVWYVRRYSVHSAELPLRPALCRKVLTPRLPAAMQSDPAGCPANGIENLQLELAVDHSEPPDGTADRYHAVSGAMDPALLARTVGLRVHLVAVDPGVTSNGPTELELSPGATMTFDDGLRRQTLSKTVPMRNLAYRLRRLSTGDGSGTPVP